MMMTDARNEPIGRLEVNVMRNTEGSKCPNSSERGSQPELHTKRKTSSGFSKAAAACWRLLRFAKGNLAHLGRSIQFQTKMTLDAMFS
eukprot:1600913-Pleurochrysis_carterae.AAC.2